MGQNFHHAVDHPPRKGQLCNSFKRLDEHQKCYLLSDKRIEMALRDSQSYYTMSGIHRSHQVSECSAFH